jgi:hypothetical protein
MREFVSSHAPTFAAFSVMVLIFVGFAGVFGPGLDRPPVRTLATPAQAIALPGPGMDADNDTYADDVDLWDGDLVVVLDVTRLSIAQGSPARPYLLVGTQDDHWRTGEGAELEWRRVVDHDPLGHPPGSPEWIESALRTGMWWRSLAMEGSSHAMAQGGLLEPGIQGVQEDAVWPQQFVVNVRDDRERVRVTVEAWDAGVSPHQQAGEWVFEVDVPTMRWRVVGGAWIEAGSAGTFGSFGRQSVGIEVALDLQSDIAWETKNEIAQRWAPVVHFHEDELFFPTQGEVMQRFHGFLDREADLRTWLGSFNNGRDGYLLLLADFTGSGSTNYEDAALMYSFLREADQARDTVYANVLRTTGGHVVVQYWFIYMYNFVLDETGREVPQLAHEGDREFMQLVFEDEQSAIGGEPLTVAYSQHYYGVVTPYEPGGPPFHVDSGRPSVFVALGSHASYPVAGTDEAVRYWFQGFGDVFYGDGEAWGPENYTVEVLGPQEWHAGFNWGPVTRHSRDLGTTTRPLLEYGFSYPFTDPLHWQSTLDMVEADRLESLYGGAP